MTKTVPLCRTLARAALLSSAAMLAVPHAMANELGTTGFSISIGDNTVAGTPLTSGEVKPSVFHAPLPDVDLRFDGLIPVRLLNVSTDDLRASYPGGEAITFRSSTNYPGYIERAEIRILDLSRYGRPVLATVPTLPNGTASWVMPKGGEGRYAYVLRVFDRNGRFDETLPLTLSRTDTRFPSHTPLGGPQIAAGEGEDRTAIRKIPVHGGMITAFGTGATPNSTVTFMGETVPVDGEGKFVISRIVPAGDHVVTVDVNGRRMRRDVYVPASDWFRVGIIDITAGRIESDDDGVGDDSYLDGRVAFYTKGKTQSGWTITASVDSSEGELEDIFDRLNDKDPRRVLDRLRESDDLYPTYGDDSIWYDDTPTAGAFYLRAENDTVRFTWGTFKTVIASPKLLSATRDLYGAELRYQSPSTTVHGDNRVVATVYAAQPETAAQRDILRGTGGSVYFLTRQDITSGSSTVIVQSVDPDTGHVKGTKVLVEGVDYTIDHLQGVLILARPLASSGSDGDLITSGSGDLDLNLVVQYEYTPTDFDPDGTAFGGRVEAWVTNNVRLGFTGMEEETGGGTQTVLGVDARVRFGNASFAELEVVRTDGPGFARSTSTDGGLTIVSTGGGPGGEATAFSFASHLDLQDLGMGMPGYLAFWYEAKEEGFSTLTEDIAEDSTLIGVEAQVDLSPNLTFGVDAEYFEKDGGDDKLTLGATVGYRFNEMWLLEAGVEYLDQTTLGEPTETGERTDIGLRLTYSPNDDLSLYAFGQATVSKSGGLPDNNRGGVGAEVQVTDAIRIEGEISDGDGGTGGKARISYAPTANNEIYFGYTLDPTREDVIGNDNGTLIFGGRYTHSERLFTWTENKYDMPGERRSVTNVFGVNYTPNPIWTLAGSVETGTVRDDTNGDFERFALSLGGTWKPDDDLFGRLRLEYRTDDGAGTAQDRETYGFAAGFSNQFSADWRMLADIEALFSDSAEGDFRDGEYARASLGFAYRPIDNERLNLLFRYSYLHDLPGEDQVDANGDTDGPKQRSHVLSANGIYDLSKRLSVGAKLGYRMSEVADRGTDVFTANTATLAALRFDWHVVHQWDIFGEGRVLWTEETDTTETGAVLGIYRHVGENIKIGIGYEWGSVSDDLTDIEYENQGVFLNVVGKF
ncbi:MAG: outer membrane beta-barrel protein [Pseudomonadota bacterium]